MGNKITTFLDELDPKVFPDLENAVDKLKYLMKERKPHERLTRSSSLPHEVSSYALDYGTHSSMKAALNVLKTKSMIEGDDSSWDGSVSSRDSDSSRESNQMQDDRDDNSEVSDLSMQDDDKSYDENDPYLLDRSNSKSKTRLKAEEYARVVMANITRDPTRHLDVTFEEIVEILMKVCTLCGRIHIPDVNDVNSMDRLFSFIRCYKLGLLTNCNLMKIWLDPAEFLNKCCLIASNYKALLPLTDIVDVADLKSRIDNDSNHYFGNKKKSISSTRKGDPAKLLKGTRAVADLKSRRCYLCGLLFACGIDRFHSYMSYAMAFHDRSAYSCCYWCNVILLDRELEAVLVQCCRIVLNTSRTFSVGDQITSIFTTPTVGMMTFLTTERQPVKCVIGGTVVMFPSLYTMESFDIKFNAGDTVQQVAIQVYNEWNNSLTVDDVDVIRFNVLDVQTSVRESFDINTYVTDERLLETDSELESSDNSNVARPPRAKRRQTYDLDEAQVRSSSDDGSVEVVPFFDTSVSAIIKTSSRDITTAHSRDITTALSIHLLDGTLMGVASSKDQAAEWASVSKDAILKALRNEENLGIGIGSRRKEMYTLTHWKPGDPIPVLGLTPSGKTHFARLTSQYPNGIVVESVKSKALAVCKSQADAAKLIYEETVTSTENAYSSVRQKISRALRLNPSDEKFGKIHNQNESNHIYNVRWLTDEDTLGVTKRGRKVLPGWNDELDGDMEYLR